MAQSKRIVQIPPHQVRNALNQAVTLQKQGQVERAKQVLLAILNDHPKNFDALNLLGVQAALLKENRTALTYFSKAHKAKPKDVKLLINLAKMENQLQLYKQSLEHFSAALKLTPNDAKIWNLMGRTYLIIGNLKDALKYSTRACELEPDNMAFALSKANFFVDSGQIDEARDLYREIASRKDNYEVAALIGIAKVTKFTQDAPEPDRLASFANDQVASAYHGAKLLYATGKAFADKKSYDTAFNYYKIAKEKFGKKFESAKYAIYCESLKTAYDQRYFDALSYKGNQSQRPVFIVGMPRSGTTLTEQICASHQKVAGAGELKDLRRVMSKLGIFNHDPTAFAKTISDMSARDLDKIGAEFLTVLKNVSKTADRVVDKMPLNFECLGLIAALFPNAKIIHCTRDPIDTCLSCYMNDFSDAHSYNNDLRSMGLFYREYKSLMAHWQKVLPFQIYESSYESLTSNQEEDTRKLIDFLDLEWDPSCLDFGANEQLVNTPSKWQVRQPLYKTSVKKWKNYEKHLGPLIDSLGDAVVTEPNN